MKKILFSLFFICIFVFPALADFTVDAVSVNAEVSTSGRTEVTATYQLTFTTAQEEVTIPLPEGELSGISVSNYRYSAKENDQGIDLVVRSNGFSGTQMFVVSYKLPAFQADGAQEDLYTLPLLSSRWAREIGTFSVQVNLPGSTVEIPEGYTMSPVLVSGYHGELDETEGATSVSGTMISGSATGLMAYDTMTLQVSLPDGYFRVRSNTIPMIAVTWWFLGMAAVLGLCMLYWRLKLRSGHKEVSARMLLPEGVLAYQLPGLLDGKSIDFRALILEWANLGYLRLSYDKKHRLVLHKTMDMGSERSQAEQRLFYRIFGRRRKAFAIPGRFSAAAEQFRTVAMRPISRQAFDKKSGNVAFVRILCGVLTGVGIGYMVYCILPEGGGYLVLSILAGAVGLYYGTGLHRGLSRLKTKKQLSWKTGLLLLLALAMIVLGLMYGAFLEITVGLFACCFSAFATASGPRRSPQGQELVAQAKGCRRFYSQVSWQKLQVYTAGNRRFFQGELPQTVALNCHKTFARRFERLSVPYPEWLPAKNKGAIAPEKLVELLEPVLKSLEQAFQ